tara:strand:+ start:1288 stop:1800 length:513 start_codon:yes stop_codon:yes gene_type:complete
MKSCNYPIYNLNDSKPSIFLGQHKNNSNYNSVASINIYPTENLLVGASISESKKNSDLSLYYQLIIGYIPDWKFFNISTHLIQIGTHRLRFNNEGGIRWFNLSFSESFKLNRMNINIGWNKIFTKKWERNSILVSTNLKLIDNIYIQLGSSSFFTPSYNLSPFILLNIKL